MIDAKQMESLIANAVDARSRAYAPYSNFRVGAAVLMESGKIYKGCNVENASYGLTICAERTALVKAVSRGETKVRAIAVATVGGATPCGACRQFIAEFADPESVVIVFNVESDEGGRVFAMSQLLPESFSAAALQKPASD